MNGQWIEESWYSDKLKLKDCIYLKIKSQKIYKIKYYI